MPDQENKSTSPASRSGPRSVLKKTPSGIAGFDDITLGGLPCGRTTLICGAAGAGKTLFGMQFLVRGILQHAEPGVFIAFEETEEDLVENVASLGFGLQELQDAGKLAMDYINVDHGNMDEAGPYDLEGLFLRIESAVNAVGAKRLVIDTLESLFGGLTDTSLLRSELRRLFRWLRGLGVTAVVTGERGDGGLTRHGLEEYVSDCVILLDHKITDEASTRRLRVVKYRGSTHGTNEYPFLIDEDGIAVLPITSAGLDHPVSTERISTGIPRLDGMLGGVGYHRGSTALISGTAGAGKSSIAAYFADATCRRGERCIIFAFEESPEQIKRNMASIGLDLARHEASGLLRFATARPTMRGLETHLAIMHKLVREFDPHAVVIDPISSLLAGGESDDAQMMAVRLVDYLKSRGVTAVMTSLTRDAVRPQTSEIAISSIIDTWLLVRTVEASGERNRVIYVLKSRGTAHSNQMREFVITNHGIELVDVYIGPEGVLTGAARAQQEGRENAAQVKRQQETARKKRELERRRRLADFQFSALREKLDAQEEELRLAIEEDQQAELELGENRLVMASRRGADDRR